MNKYHFLCANDKDISEILALYHSLIGTPGCTWNLDYPNKEIVEADIQNKSLYVLKDNDQIMAVAVLSVDNELEHLRWTLKKPCDLSRIGVVSTRQKQGIATIMLRNIIEAAKKRGLDGIRMLVSKANAAALALYDKNGFTRCGETLMYGIDFYCYQMEFHPAV